MPPYDVRPCKNRIM